MNKLLIFSILAIIAVFAFLLRSCAIISKGEPVYTSAGEKSMYNKTKNNVYCWISGLCIHVKGADAKTFEALSPNIGKDKNRAYYSNVGDINVDVQTFECVPGNDYLSFRDKNNVYYVSGYPPVENKIFKILPDADLATYQDLGNGWSKDNKNVYYLHEKVDADPQTFVNINKQYSKDNNYLYSQEPLKSLKKEKCNTDELIPIPESRYIRTNTKIYYSVDKYFSYLPIKDTASIEILKLHGNRWLKVDEKIVIDGRWLDDPTVDEKTFVSLDKQFFKDKNHVYYWKWTVPGETKEKVLNIIVGVDLDTFEQIGGDYSKDKNHVYYEHEVMPDVNPKDFRYDEAKNRLYSGNDVYSFGEKKQAKK
jgi:hypothetical protein